MQVATLTLPNFPQPELARALSPNGRSHWADRAAAVRLVHLAVRVALLLDPVQPIRGPVRIVATYAVPDRRRRDLDNFSAVLKPVLDALVRANVIEEDNVRIVQSLDVRIVHQPGTRCLTLEITPGEGRDG